MKKNFSFYLAILFTIAFSNSQAQVAINDDGSVPHPSAMLDVKVTAAAKKGVLIPRMTTAERVAIVAPAPGLVVYDNTTSTFWYYTGTLWQQLSPGGANVWNKVGNNIYNNNSGNVGIGITTPKAKLHVAKMKPVIFGDDSLGLGEKVFWLPSKAAFRAGVVEDLFMGGPPYNWDYSNIGVGSFAGGNSTRAKGFASTAFGQLSVSTGSSSFAAGLIAQATADYSAAFGEYTAAQGAGAFAAGLSATAFSDASTAFGWSTSASGEASFAANESTNATGINSASFGVSTESRGNGTFAIGTYNDPVLGAPETTIGMSTNATPLFIVGNGSFGANSNALVVNRSGRMGIRKNPGIAAISDAALQIKSIPAFHALALEASGTTNKWSFEVTTNMALYYNNALRGTFNSATGAYVAVSDMRLKKDITPIANVLSGLLRLNTYTYHLLDNKSDDPLSYGLMAQEVEKEFPLLVNKMQDENNKTIYGLNYNNITVLAIRAIQEQQQEIDRLDKTIKQQQIQIDEQKKMLNEIMKRIER